MFDIAPTELMLVALVALVVIGPKDLPRLMRVVGQWVARARGMARHFRSGFDEMIRQSEIEEMERKWAEENARIMREHPVMREEGAPAMTPLPPPRDGAPDSPPAADAPAADTPAVDRPA
ncbi:MAG: Sec-independent protein translocase protein TatB [Sphingomonas sp.]|nr:Sec-independent protein translocase protein TatB [Sphingomonas sp.]MDX3884992.1 Sec-independent protein translocase protein TatB [Sphingomonas sp.]